MSSEFSTTARAPSPLPTLVVCNGEAIQPHEASISVLGKVLYGSFGVYESIQLWNGVVFHLEDHLRRLSDSARQIDLPLCGGLDEHRRWLHRCIAAEGVDQGTIRLFAVGPDGERPPRSFIWLEPVRQPAPALHRSGVGVVTYPGERALPGAKTLNNLVNTLAAQRARATGEHEGLLLDRDGCLTEGASSNFYTVQAGSLVLPPSQEILSGVTLEVVLELAREAGIPIRRERLPLAARARWEEAFITSTTRHVLPVVRIDGDPVGEGAPGPVTRILQERFEAYFLRTVGTPYFPHTEITDHG